MQCCHLSGLFSQTDRWTDLSYGWVLFLVSRHTTSCVVRHNFHQYLSDFVIYHMYGRLHFLSTEPICVFFWGCPYIDIGITYLYLSGIRWNFFLPLQSFWLPSCVFTDLCIIKVMVFMFNPVHVNGQIRQWSPISTNILDFYGQRVAVSRSPAAAPSRFCKFRTSPKRARKSADPASSVTRNVSKKAKNGPKITQNGALPIYLLRKHSPVE
jgi:hypothetical protein